MSDREGFKVPSLPVGRAKHVSSDKKEVVNEQGEKNGDSQKVPEDSSQQELKRDEGDQKQPQKVEKKASHEGTKCC